MKRENDGFNRRVRRERKESFLASFAFFARNRSGKSLFLKILYL